MKPQHASLTRLRRCPCCQSRYSKKNAGTSKSGNSAARQQVKRSLARDLSDNS